MIVRLNSVDVLVPSLKAIVNEIFKKETYTREDIRKIIKDEVELQLKENITVVLKEEL